MERQHISSRLVCRCVVLGWKCITPEERISESINVNADNRRILFCIVVVIVFVLFSFKIGSPSWLCCVVFYFQDMFTAIPTIMGIVSPFTNNVGPLTASWARTPPPVWHCNAEKCLNMEFIDWRNIMEVGQESPLLIIALKLNNPSMDSSVELCS